MIRYSYEPLEGLRQEMIGSVDCGSLLAHLTTKKTLKENMPAGALLRTQQAMQQGELGEIFRPPGIENPADRLTKVRSDMAPPLRPLESGQPQRNTVRGIMSGDLVFTTQLSLRPISSTYL